MNFDWTVITTIITAVLVFVGTVYGVKKSSKNDRDKLVQEWAQVISNYGQTVTSELDKLKQTEDSLREKLILVKDEYAIAKIEHREALAEKDQIIREQESTIREMTLQKQETEQILADTRVLLIHSSHELIAARSLIQVQADFIREEREAHG